MNIKRRDFIRAGGMLAIAGVGAVPYAGLRKRLEGQNHFFA